MAAISIGARPSGIIKDKDSDDMIFTNYDASSINRLAPDGTISLISNAAGLNGPVGLAYDDAGNLYAGNYNDRGIYKISPDGNADYIATVPGSRGVKNLGFISYGQGMLWGTVLQDHKIYQINPNGINETSLFAGSIPGNTDSNLDEATFNQPNGILFDEPNNTIYVTDFGSKNLRIIDGVSLGLDENRITKLTLFPVPSVEVLNIQGLGFLNEKYTLHIYNSVGSIVFSSEGFSNGNQLSEAINISVLNSGIYFLEIKSGMASEIIKWVK